MYVELVHKVTNHRDLYERGDTKDRFGGVHYFLFKIITQIHTTIKKDLFSYLNEFDLLISKKGRFIKIVYSLRVFGFPKIYKN